jgi:hypothetical protein
MQFNVLHVEPQGYRFAHLLHSIGKALCVGLESIGHDCCMQPNAFGPTHIPIILGAHLLTSPNEVDALAARGPCIVLQTEVISDLDQAAKNWGPDRFSKVFLPLIRRARVVWDVLEENLPALAQLGANGKLLRLGWHPQLEEITPKHTKDVDFLFFGSVTPHRHRMLTALEARGHRLVHIFDDHAHFRNDLIARTKVNLSLGHGETRRHLPWPRMSFLLNNRALVVSERLQEQEWLERSFVSAPTNQWIDVCVETLKRPDRQQLAEAFYEQFRTIRLSDQVQKVLDESHL